MYKCSCITHHKALGPCSMLNCWRNLLTTRNRGTGFERWRVLTDVLAVHACHARSDAAQNQQNVLENDPIVAAVVVVQVTPLHQPRQGASSTVLLHTHLIVANMITHTLYCTSLSRYLYSRNGVPKQNHVDASVSSRVTVEPMHSGEPCLNQVQR